MKKGGSKGCKIAAWSAVLMVLLLGIWSGTGMREAKAATHGDFTYTENSNGTAKITFYNGSGGDVVIPSKVGPSSDLTVTEIGTRAFSRRNVTSVTIPDSVITIHDHAFSINQLTSVTIPDSVTHIGGYAFSENQLTNVTILGNLISMGERTFQKNQLGSLTLPDSVTTIGYGAFEDNRLTSVTLPADLTSLGPYAFARNQLTSVTIPNRVTKIGEGTFTNNRLASVTIPDSVTSLGYLAFAHNELTSVTIPARVNSIDEVAFLNNRLTEAIIEGPSTRISTNSFNNNSSPIMVGYQNIKNYASSQGFGYKEIVSVSFQPNGDSSWAQSHSTDVDVVSSYITGIQAYQWTKAEARPNSSGWQEFSSGDTISTPSEAGSLVLHVRFKDRNGYESFYYSNRFNVDQSPPVIQLSTGASSPSNQNVAITATIDDPHSGLQLTKWASGTQPLSYFSAGGGTSFTKSFNVTDNGTYTVYARDNVGNEAVETIVVSYDGDFEYADNKDGTATIVSYKGSGGNIVIPSKVSDADLIVTAIGENAFKSKNVTNVTIPALVTSIDQQAFMGNPTLIMVGYENIRNYASSHNFGYKEIVSVSFQPKGHSNWAPTHSTDVEVVSYIAGTQAYQWTKTEEQPNSSGWQEFSSGDTISTSSETGSLVLHVRFKDENEYESLYHSDSFNVDQSPPTIHLTSSSANQNATITAKIDDSHSGLELTKWASGAQPLSYFSTGGGTSFTSSFEVKKNGTYTVYARDNAGNKAVETIAINNIGNNGGSGGSGGLGGDGRSGSGNNLGVITSTNGTITIPVGSSGEVHLGGEVVIKAPNGAAEQELRITIEKLIATSVPLTDQEQLVSQPFEVLKNFNNNFKKPVTLSIKFDPAKVGKNQKIALYYYDEEKKRWVEIGGQINDEWITAQVDHFTKFAVLAVDIKKDGSKATPKQPEPTFTDIIGHWGERSIIRAAAQKHVSGYPDGTFKPDNPISRAEFMVMLVGALKLEGSGTSLTFKDQAKIGSWAKQAVALAVEAGIVSGYEDGSLRPDAPITRAETASMIARAQEISLDANARSGFTDDEDIPNWAKGAVEAMRKLGIVSGRGDNKFSPNDTTTRAEAVVMLLRMLEYKNE
ncbi:leucine-rich repeat protein [Aneurinibacillus sp. REN35]|uniref:leucine-rich repeat protein n=1 Tax=Aneurinibacillus sp. REN35 TaxID=3237286 RepID=UPI003529B83A